MSAKEATSDTLNLILCNNIHIDLTAKQISAKLSKCAKGIRDRSNDSVLVSYCRKVIKGNEQGKYNAVIQSVLTLDVIR